MVLSTLLGKLEANVGGLTWARNDFDDRALSFKELCETFLKLKTQHQAQFGKPLKAVRLSRLTLGCFPVYVATQDAQSMSSFYGVPIEIDDSLELWEFKAVYA